MNNLNAIAKLERELLTQRHKHKDSAVTSGQRYMCDKAIKRIERELIGLRIHTVVSDKMIY